MSCQVEETIISYLKDLTRFTKIYALGFSCHSSKVSCIFNDKKNMMRKKYQN